MNKNKLSFGTRIRLCWDILTRGKYDSRDYKTMEEHEQWSVCEKRREELNACNRPRTEFRHKDDDFEQ